MKQLFSAAPFFIFYLLVYLHFSFYRRRIASSSRTYMFLKRTRLPFLFLHCNRKNRGPVGKDKLTKRGDTHFHRIMRHGDRSLLQGRLCLEAEYVSSRTKIYTPLSGRTIITALDGHRFKKSKKGKKHRRAGEELSL